MWKKEVGARCVQQWPFWHHFAPFWQENAYGTFSNLLHSGSFLGLWPHLLDNLMQWFWLWVGEGAGKVCSVATSWSCRFGCKHRKRNIPATPACFQVGPSLRVTAKNTSRTCNEADWGCGPEAVGQNAWLNLPPLSAQLSGRASHAQIHTGDAAWSYTCASILRFEFWAVCGKKCTVSSFHYVF